MSTPTPNLRLGISIIRIYSATPVGNRSPINSIAISSYIIVVRSSRYTVFICVSMIVVPWLTGRAARSTSTPTPNLQSGSTVDQPYPPTPACGLPPIKPITPGTAALQELYTVNNPLHPLDIL